MSRRAGRARGTPGGALRGVGAAFGAVLGSAILLLTFVPAVIGAEPSPSAAGGDVRTDPAAPGLVGDPLFAIAGVLLVGLAAVAVTLLATRLADRGPR